MADTYDFTNYYGADPWGDITLNEREWYDPILRDIYYRQSVYSQHATMKVDMNGPKARTIYFNDLIPPRPNISPINARAMEATRLYTDSYQKSVTTQRYGNGMALHRESEMFSYWQRNGGGTGFGLLPIIQQSLGQVMVDHLDLLARNAYFSHPYPLLGLSSATSLSGISNDDKLTTGLIDSIWLGMRDRSRPFAALPNNFDPREQIFCITTAGAIHDLKNEISADGSALSFVDAYKYTDNLPLVSGEIGAYRGMRFVDNGLAKLWNMGTITHQASIKAAVTPGDGAPDPETTLVEGVRRVGQPASTHSILVDDSSGFAAGDMVTIHKLRHTAGTVVTYRGAGVENGPKFDDAMLQNVEIHSVPDGTHITLKEPYMMASENGKGLETDLGGTVYGYVTKAKDIHTALFLTSSEAGIINGVAQPPVIYTPPPVDDYQSMYRVAYDFWMNFTLWEPRVFELAFLTGQNRLMGAMYR